MLLRGARQVGKSSVVRAFAKEFKYFVEVNLESNAEALYIFENVSNPKEICNQLSVLFNTPIKENETLLFIDEIQVSTKAINLLRYFYEQYQELHLIAAGSLLEFALQEITSFGVGRVSSVFMYPFSFK